MRSKGYRFTLGVWGLRACSLDVPQPFATARNRPEPSARGRSDRAYMGTFCKRGHFWRFPASRSFVSRGRSAFQTCFVTCQKYFFVASAIFLHGFQHMSCSFRGRRSSLETSILNLRGRRSTLDVVFQFCCESHCQRCAKW